MSEKKESECPTKLFSSAFSNGFGFQLQEGKGYLVIAFLWQYNGESVNTAITEAAATKLFQDQFPKTTARVDSWLTRTYLEVHWQEYDRIPELLQFALDAGFSLTLQSKLDVFYAAGDRFNPHKTEEKFVQRFRRILDEYFQRPGCNDPDPWLIAYQNHWQLLAKWNWVSPAGQKFCEELRTHFPDKVKEEDVDNPRYNYFQFLGVDEAARKYKLLQYGTWWWWQRPSKEQHEEKNDDAPQCAICLERVANTLVLPCGHVVVCALCSEMLQHTPDAKVCVQCRNEIQKVIQDD